MSDRQPPVTRRTVEGWLRGCIKDHGPITEQNIASASKRIWGQMAGLDIESYWKSRYRKLRYAYDNLRENHATLDGNIECACGARLEPCKVCGDDFCPNCSDVSECAS